MRLETDIVGLRKVLASLTPLHQRSEKVHSSIRRYNIMII